MIFSISNFKKFVYCSILLLMASCKKVNEFDIRKAPVENIVEETIVQENEKENKFEQDNLNARDNEQRSNDDEEIIDNQTNDLYHASRKITAAILAPMKQQKNYKNMIDAGQMAIFDFKNYVDLNLLVIDSDKSLEEVEKEIIDLLNQNVDFIIGSTLSEKTNFAYGFVKDEGITVLSISEDDNCAFKENYFNLAVLQQDKITRLFNQAKEDGNISVLIAPKNEKNSIPFDKVYYYDINPQQSMRDLSKIIKEVKQLSLKEKISLIVIDNGWRLKRLETELRSIENVKLMTIEESDIGGISTISYPINKVFYDNFKNNFGYEPNKFAFYVYDAIHFFLFRDQNKQLKSATDFKIDGCYAQRKITVIDK